jgi:2,3-bisphosphoglycerate-dependent phosphoglycerate mutase
MASLSVAPFLDFLAVMQKLLLIRHCEATAQHADAPLTATGTKAAEALGARLRYLSPDAIYSSPYERACATVRPFAVLVGLPMTLDDRLRERVLSDHDLEDWLDHLRRSFADSNYRAPGGESLNQAQSRAVAALADIAITGHRLPVVVSHGNLIASVLHSMDASFGFAQWQQMRNPDLFEVETDAGRPVRFVRCDP